MIILHVPSDKEAYGTTQFCQGLASPQIDGIVDYGLSIWKYRNDLILFMDHDLEKVVTLILILRVFEQIPG